MKCKISKRSGVVAIGLAALVGCASTAHLNPGNPLPGIGLGAAGQFVLLSWADDSPLARQMQPRSQVDILASYPTENGPVTNEPISSTSVVAQADGVRFALPEELQHTPTGPVCLRLRANRQIIPVRIPTSLQTSDGFYYAEWEVHATSKARRSSIERRISITEKSIANFEAPDTDFDSWRTRRNLVSVDQCSTLTSQANDARPRSALQGLEKRNAARTHCVALFNSFTRQMRRLRSSAEGVNNPKVTPLEAAQEIRNLLPADSTLSSAAQDLVNEVTEFGAGQLYFDTASLAIDEATNRTLLLANGKFTPVTARTILEVRNACISEAETRMDQSYQSWRSNNSNTARAARDIPLQDECRARFQNQANRIEQLEDLMNQRRSLEQELRSVRSTAGSSLPNQKNLIPHACQVN